MMIFKLGLDGNDLGTFFDQLGTIGVPGRARLNSANSLEAPTKPLEITYSTRPLSVSHITPSAT